MAEQVFRVQRDDHDRRLDRIARRLMPDSGLSSIYHLIRVGRIRLNGRKVRPSARVSEGDEITVVGGVEEGASSSARESFRVERTPDLARLILLETEDLLVINKPRGALVHGRESLDASVKAYLSARLSPSLSFHPGPLHRLDRNTSGVLVFSKSLRGAQAFSQLLATQRIAKYYLALLDGSLGTSEEWRDRLERNEITKTTVVSGAEGTQALTVVDPLVKEAGITLAMLEIRTGRTHQIRSQAAAHGHPLAGDRKYGGSALLSSYVLHAAAMVAPEGFLDAGLSSVSAPLPTSSRNAVATLLGEEALEAAEEAVRAALSA